MKTRNDFPKFLTDNNCKIGIEIGSYRGNHAKYLLDNWQGYLYLVDVWKEMDESEYTVGNCKENPKESIVAVFDNLSGYEDRTTLIRGSSNNTDHLFPDEFFDFIYIDANHKYKYVLHDMKKWYPKLKTGGIFAGHDFIADYDINKADENGDVHVWLHNINTPEKIEYSGMFGVNKAVQDFCTAINKDFQVTDEYLATWYFKK